MLRRPSEVASCESPSVVTKPEIDSVDRVPAVILLAAAVLVARDTAGAAVLCAKPRKDGSFNTDVKIREACKPGEVQLDAAAVGFC